MEMTVMQKRQRDIAVMFVLLIILSAGSMQITEFELQDALTVLPKAVLWMIGNFYPNAESLANLSSILTKLKETVFLAIVTTTTASIFALLFALMSTRSNTALTILCRLTASFFRNVPDTVWADRPAVFVRPKHCFRVPGPVLYDLWLFDQIVY